MLVIHRSNSKLYSSYVLEFPSGNEIAHLLGVFMRSKFFFFTLSVSDLTLPRPEKVVINFMGV